MSALPTCPQPFVIAFSGAQPDELTEIRKALHMATTELEQIKAELVELKRRFKAGVRKLELCESDAREVGVTPDDIRYAIDTLLGTVSGPEVST